MEKNPTKQALALIRSLEEKGITIIPEYNDGHKTVDIFIPAVGLYIEIDGLHHYTEPKQIISDLQRDHFSDDEGFLTKHIPNQLIETHLEEVSKAISIIVKERGLQYSKTAK